MADRFLKKKSNYSYRTNSCDLQIYLVQHISLVPRAVNGLYSTSFLFLGQKTYWVTYPATSALINWNIWQRNTPLLINIHGKQGFDLVPLFTWFRQKNKEDFAGLLQDLSFCCVIHWFQCKQKAGRGQLCWNPSSSTAFLLGALNLLFFHSKTKPELQTIRSLSHQATINTTCICTVFSYSLLCEPLNETEIGITWGEAERENLMGTAWALPLLEIQATAQ